MDCHLKTPLVTASWFIVGCHLGLYGFSLKSSEEILIHAFMYTFKKYVYDL